MRNEEFIENFNRLNNIFVGWFRQDHGVDNYEAAILKTVIIILFALNNNKQLF